MYHIIEAIPPFLGSFSEMPECQCTGACPGFLKGGGPISLGSLKKRSSDFKRGGPMVRRGARTLVSQ